MAIQKKTQEVKDNNVKVTRVNQWKDGNITFDLNVNGVTIYGMKVISYQDKNTGLLKEFFAFPNKKGSDGNYYNHVFVKLSDNDVDSIEKQISDML